MPNVSLSVESIERCRGEVDREIHSSCVSTSPKRAAVRSGKPKRTVISGERGRDDARSRGLLK